MSTKVELKCGTVRAVSELVSIEKIVALKNIETF
jgi:hypothetical protein